MKITTRRRELLLINLEMKMSFNNHIKSSNMQILDKIASESKYNIISVTECDSNYKILSRVKRYALCGNTGIRYIRNEDWRDSNKVSFTYKCGSPLCKSCSKVWAIKQANKLYEQCGNADHSKFRMLTCMIDLADSPEEAIFKFNRFKLEVNKLLDNIRKKKTRKNINTEGYRNLAFAGSLELDLVKADKFLYLGDKKQDQYISMFGYAMGEDVPVRYMVTYHAIVYCDGLKENDIIDLFKRGGSRVHLKELYPDQPINESIENIVGYSAKMFLSTTYDQGFEEEWSDEIKEDYFKFIIKDTSGRRSFKFCKKQFKAR